MTRAENVWANIHKASTRRINSESDFNYFWVCDEKGRYGLMISLKFLLSDRDFEYQLRGISTIKNVTNDDSTDVYFILNNTDDWEIFYSLCLDLIEISKKSHSEKELTVNLKKRLKRWLLFLSEENTLSLSESRQMGLFAELLCLKDILLPNISTDNAIVSWVGPNFDLQDFSLPNFFIEVKSFISSKGEIVSISSLRQLTTEIKSLYLIAFGLTRNDNGMSIPDVARLINTLLANNPDTIELFEQKLAECGFIDGITHEPFYRYGIDKVKCFAVKNNFPRILVNSVPEQIISAQYRIDLSRCKEFETDIQLLFK